MQPEKSAEKSEATTAVKESAKSKNAAPAPKSKDTKSDSKGAKPAAESKEPKAAPKTAASDACKRRIDTPEIQEKIRELIKLAKSRTISTFDDINDILPNDLVDPDDVESIMERLRNMEFDIIDASEVDRYKDKKGGSDDGEDEELKMDQKLDILDDPVRMYLKQMVKAPAADPRAGG